MTMLALRPLVARSTGCSAQSMPRPTSRPGEPARAGRDRLPGRRRGWSALTVGDRLGWVAHQRGRPPNWTHEWCSTGPASSLRDQVEAVTCGRAERHDRASTTRSSSWWLRRVWRRAPGGGGSLPTCLPGRWTDLTTVLPQRPVAAGAGGVVPTGPRRFTYACDAAGTHRAARPGGRPDPPGRCRWTATQVELCTGGTGHAQTSGAIRSPALDPVTPGRRSSCVSRRWCAVPAAAWGAWEPPWPLAGWVGADATRRLVR
jgi:hypothetical protein